MVKIRNTKNVEDNKLCLYPTHLFERACIHQSMQYIVCPQILIQLLHRSHSQKSIVQSTKIFLFFKSSFKEARKTYRFLIFLRESDNTHSNAGIMVFHDSMKMQESVQGVIDEGSLSLWGCSSCSMSNLQLALVEEIEVHCTFQRQCVDFK